MNGTSDTPRDWFTDDAPPTGRFIWYKQKMQKRVPGRTSCFGSGFFVKVIGGEIAAFGKVVTHNEDELVVDWYEGYNGHEAPQEQQTIPMDLVTKEGNDWEDGTSDPQSE